MMPLRKRRRVQVIALAAGALVLSSAMIGYAMRDGIAYFRSPSEVAAAPPAPAELFRIGGLVEAGSLARGQGETVTFRVTDGGAAIPVAFTGILPDLFAEGQGAIALGRMEGGTFRATEVLAKHDETYMPREVVEALREQGVYRGADEAADATRGGPGND